jgi:isoleucyl-tRNA synthetase
MRKKDNSLAESVFLSEFPVANEKYTFTEESKKIWEKLFALREKTLLKCEELRKEKKIGSNLDAALNIFDNGSLKSVDKELISNVTGTWDVAVSQVTDPGNKQPDIEVSADVSKHAKCDRCWRHKDDVNTANKYGSSLCGRCVEALNSL